MLAIGDSILRSINFVFLVIALGLTCSLAANTISHSNSQVNFAAFASAFGLLTSSIYGVLAYFIAVMAWPVLLAGFDFLNLVFTFSAAAALAVAIRVHSCGNEEYVDNNTVAQGSSDRCRKAQASVAFLFFSFIVFLASTIFSMIGLCRGGLFGRSKTATSA